MGHTGRKCAGFLSLHDRATFYKLYTGPWLLYYIGGGTYRAEGLKPHNVVEPGMKYACNQWLNE